MITSDDLCHDSYSYSYNMKIFYTPSSKSVKSPGHPIQLNNLLGIIKSQNS